MWKSYVAPRNDAVETTVHGQRIVVNCGYSYPVNSRYFPSYNQPLVELVHQASAALGRPLHFVDIGAAVGDTVLLISSNCPGEVAHYHAIDGDPEFFGYLSRNLAARNDCTLYNILLSSNDGEIASLVRTHQGTASAQGAVPTQAMTLDTCLAEPVARGEIDVVKIDIDGFDGRALAGAGATLDAATAVIFEWHPILYRQTGNDPLEPFRVLERAGYVDLVWFSKFGEFDQITKIPSEEVLNHMVEYCLSDIADDWHWDIAAVKQGSAISLVDLARMDFARKRPSHW